MTYKRILGSETSVSIGDGVAVVHRKGISAPIVAQILGADLDGEGKPCRYYLDRLVHRPGEHFLGEFTVSGAVSSILGG